MGMRDQSWCASCGAGMLYTEDENVTCYRCDQDEYNKLETRCSKFMEYMNIHLISLNQDKDQLQLDYVHSDNEDTLDYILIKDGQIEATKHLMSVATDILMSSNERV